MSARNREDDVALANKILIEAAATGTEDAVNACVLSCATAWQQAFLVATAAGQEKSIILLILRILTANEIKPDFWTAFLGAASGGHVSAMILLEGIVAKEERFTEEDRLALDHDTAMWNGMRTNRVDVMQHCATRGAVCHSEMLAEAAGLGLINAVQSCAIISARTKTLLDWKLAAEMARQYGHRDTQLFCEITAEEGTPPPLPAPLPREWSRLPSIVMTMSTAAAVFCRLVEPDRPDRFAQAESGFQQTLTQMVLRNLRKDEPLVNMCLAAFAVLKRPDLESALDNVDNRKALSAIENHLDVEENRIELKLKLHDASRPALDMILTQISFIWSDIGTMLRSFKTGKAVFEGCWYLRSETKGASISEDVYKTLVRGFYGRESGHWILALGRIGLVWDEGLHALRIVGGHAAIGRTYKNSNVFEMYECSN